MDLLIEGFKRDFSLIFHLDAPVDRHYFIISQGFRPGLDDRNGAGSAAGGTAWQGAGHQSPERFYGAPSGRRRDEKIGRTTVIMSTHDREQAARLADTVVMMSEGRTL